MNKFNLKFDANTELEALEILKAVGSKDKAVSMAAMTSLAQLVGPVVDQVLDHQATSSLIYQIKPYSLGDVPSIPIDLYFDNIEGTFLVWSQNIAGGLPSNQVWGSDEYRFTTWTIASAVHWLKSYAEKSRPDLDVVTKAIQRMAQEVLAKQEYQLWSILLGAVGQVRTNGVSHLAAAAAGNGTFTVADVNTLWTKVARLRKSWLNGTPVNRPGRGLTDLFVSPEVMGDIRAMAYNPANTVAVPDQAESTALGLPDSVRERIFQTGGWGEIFGVKIHEIQEFGVGQPYNSLFDDLYTSSGSDVTFNSATQEIALGVDLSVPSALKVEAVDSDSGSVFRAEPDDQWASRSKKVGFWGEAEMGAIVVDSKAFYGIVV